MTAKNCRAKNVDMDSRDEDNRVTLTDDTDR